jgi:hypothetical protein
MGDYPVGTGGTVRDNNGGGTVEQGVDGKCEQAEMCGVV